MNCVIDVRIIILSAENDENFKLKKAQFVNDLVRLRDLLIADWRMSE
jgi:hypothetical protein